MSERRPGVPSWVARSVQNPAPASRAVPARSALATAAARAPQQPSGIGMDSAAVRARMVQRLAATGIQSPAVLAANQPKHCHYSYHAQQQHRSQHPTDGKEFHVDRPRS